MDYHPMFMLIRLVDLSSSSLPVQFWLIVWVWWDHLSNPFFCYTLLIAFFHEIILPVSDTDKKRLFFSRCLSDIQLDCSSWKIRILVLVLLIALYQIFEYIIIVCCGSVYDVTWGLWRQPVEPPFCQILGGPQSIWLCLLVLYAVY